MGDVELRIPLCSSWTDSQLAASDDRDFAELLYDRAIEVAKDLYSETAYNLFDLDPEVKASRLVFYLRRRAWAEWYFGTVTPAKQISLLSDSQVDLKLRLARQIVDEMRHHDVFSHEVRRRGGDPTVSSFAPPSALTQMKAEQVNSDSVAELAAANQYSGEIVLLATSYEDNNVLRRLVDERVFAAIRDIETDEPAHVAIGRDLVMQYSHTPLQRRRLADAQERFLRAQLKQHASELELLGATRHKPLPVFI